MEEKTLNYLKSLNEQYRQLRKDNLVHELRIIATTGVYKIKNNIAIQKVIDLLIRESQIQIEMEVNKE
jgi:hypothetical protein